ncbi:MAG: family 20 glycosylhydrolase [Eubacteriales bacterium]|nr:family 20 glycosylhydrolase [Eubacteriales bacterium]
MYLVPKPQNIETFEGSHIIAFDSYLCLDKECDSLLNKQVLLFLEKLEGQLGYPLLVSKHKSKKGDMLFLLDNDRKEESYELDSTGDNIVLKGDKKGLWHGMQTILQIVSQTGAAFPRVKIVDFPTMANRGHYMDVTRGRIPKVEWIKKWIDQLAYYKINQFQLYIEHSYLFRDLTELWRDDTPYTAKDIMELDQYCMERGIEMVPSLSSFGHLYKLLSTKEYKHLCELEDSDQKPFSVLGRMQHHTVDVTNPESMALIKDMISEFMGLFASRQFNICADETFDLGTGKSKEKAEKVGKSRLYIEYVKELAEFLVENGRRPMFWGDVIVGFPELIKELPEETICLTWGYAINQRDYETMKMAEAGATQYCCPGCCGWNEIVNLNWNSYNNIKLMAQHAQKYGAIGLLNTDWGDFLHVNHPDFSLVGMIYGAAFSWNHEVPEYEEINQQISKIAFGDTSEKLLAVIDEVRHNTAYSWQSFCHYAELEMGVASKPEFQQQFIRDNIELLKDVEEKCENLLQIKNKLYEIAQHLPAEKRAMLYPYLVSVEGIRVINLVGKYVAQKDLMMEFKSGANGKQIAAELDTWFYYYKQIYRSMSRDSELYRMQAFMNFYGDLLRS